MRGRLEQPMGENVRDANRFLGIPDICGIGRNRVYKAGGPALAAGVDGCPSWCFIQRVFDHCIDYGAQLHLPLLPDLFGLYAFHTGVDLDPASCGSPKVLVARMARATSPARSSLCICYAPAICHRARRSRESDCATFGPTPCCDRSE